MKNQETLYKEIDQIQGCITRMAQNSFMVKGWLITLLAVILALLPETVSMRLLCVVGFIVILCFWYLDGFFLKMEKIYRWKYEWVIARRNTCEEYCYDLNPYNKNMWLCNKDGKSKSEPAVISIMLTKTLIPLYAPLLLLVVFLFINSYKCWL